MIKTCKHCNGTFVFDFSAGLTATAYCSDECREAVRVEYQRIYHRHYQRKITRLRRERRKPRRCPTCRKLFSDYRLNQLYCCEACRQDAQWRRQAERRKYASTESIASV